MVDSAAPVAPLTNWSRNVTYTPERFHRPTSVAQVQEIVAGARRVRALGTGHTFNRIADTSGDMVSLRDLPTVIEIDSAAATVRVSAGTRYGELGHVLQSAGWALPNTGSLPHISVAGACATGTHGSGTRNRVLASAVRAQTMVTASGDLETVDRTATGADFDGCILGLGRLGLVTELTLDLEPTFDVAQTVVVGVSDESVQDTVQEILAAAYSVSIFTVWARDEHRVWLKERSDRPGAWTGEPLWGGRAATGPEHPVAGMPAEHATEQLGVAGPWNERLPHFRLAFTPSAGEELQSEYLLPIGQAAAAWSALVGLRDQLPGLLLAGEVRTIAADPLWLSTTGGVDACAFHFTWIDDLPRVLPVLRQIEAALLPLGARPHWGKVFTVTDAEIAALYPRLDDVRRLVLVRDPDGKLGNDLVDGWLGLRP